MLHEKKRIGVVGTGFVSTNFVNELGRRSEYELSRVLTRRDPASLRGFPRSDAVTNSVQEVIDTSDLVFECSGDPDHAAAVVGPVLDAGIPVVTMNAEFHVTLGSAFVDRGLLTEAEGDQPGCLAALREQAHDVGMDVLAYVNMKAFLDRNPSRESMMFWANKQHFSLPMVTAFTDGTKVQIEQCLTANGLDADIAQEDLLGAETADLAEAAAVLGPAAESLGRPISDYILDRSVPHGVFVVGTFHNDQSVPLENYKLGKGPYYTLLTAQCLVHLDAFKTIRRVFESGTVLLNNSRTPRISVATVAKREMRPGELVERGGGSFDVRGVCVRIAERPGHIPICLANEMHIKRRVEPGQVLTLDEVEFAESSGIETWQSIERRVLVAVEPAQERVFAHG